MDYQKLLLDYYCDYLLFQNIFHQLLLLCKHTLYLKVLQMNRDVYLVLLYQTLDVPPQRLPDTPILPNFH